METSEGDYCGTHHKQEEMFMILKLSMSFGALDTSYASIVQSRFFSQLCPIVIHNCSEGLNITSLMLSCKGLLLKRMPSLNLSASQIVPHMLRWGKRIKLKEEAGVNDCNEVKEMQDNKHVSIIVCDEDHLWAMATYNQWSQRLCSIRTTRMVLFQIRKFVP